MSWRKTIIKVMSFASSRGSTGGCRAVARKPGKRVVFCRGLIVFDERMSGGKMTKTIAAIFLLLLHGTVSAQTPSFQGKTITIVVGTVAGDLYDLYARAIGLFMGRYLPGNPNMIVQNMPGAGHMIAANYVFTVAKPDGLTLGAINAGLYFEQLIGRPQVKFDWTKFTWVGNATKSPQVLYMRADTPFKSVEDVRSAKEAPKCGTTGMSN